MVTQAQTQAQNQNIVCFDYVTTICIDVDKITSPKPDRYFEAFINKVDSNYVYSTNFNDPFIISYIEFPWYRFNIGKAKKTENPFQGVIVKETSQVMKEDIQVGKKIIKVSDFDDYYVEGYEIMTFVIRKIKIVDIEIVRSIVFWDSDFYGTIEKDTSSMVIKAIINGFIVIKMWFGEQYVNNVNVVAYITITAQNPEVAQVFNEIYVKRTNIEAWKKIDWNYIIMRVSEIFVRANDSIIIANITKKYNIFKYYRKIGKARITKIINHDTGETKDTWITIYYCPRCKKYMMGVAHVISHIYYCHKRNNNK